MILPKDILHKYWGHSSFRSSQEEIIESVIRNKDVVALLPTGAGKSLCYQLPAGYCHPSTSFYASILHQLLISTENI